MKSSKMKMLIAGDFGDKHFSDAQEQFIFNLAKINSGEVRLLHIHNPSNLPDSDNQASFIRDYEEASLKIKIHLDYLYKRLENAGIPVSYYILDHGDFKNEFSAFLDLYEPDFVLTKKDKDALIYRHFCHRVPVLFIPERVKENSPENFALITVDTGTFPEDKIGFFMNMARNTTGNIKVLRLNGNGKAGQDVDVLKRTLHEVNLFHGINIDLIRNGDSSNVKNVSEAIGDNNIDMAFILCRREKKFGGLIQTEPLKDLVRKMDCPFFYCLGG